MTSPSGAFSANSDKTLIVFDSFGWVGWDFSPSLIHSISDIFSVKLSLNYFVSTLNH